VAGRFPLYTDADVQGPVVKALRRAGWDLVRAIDEFREKTPDLRHFQRAVALGRVLVTNDDDQRQIARGWHREGRPFPGLVWWPQKQYQKIRPGDVVRLFAELATKERPFFPYPIVHLKVR
jgi:hypothetical protein